MLDYYIFGKITVPIRSAASDEEKFIPEKSVSSLQLQEIG